MSDDWNPGDLAECIDDKWEDLDGNPSPCPGLPTLGSVHMVSAVTILPHPKSGPAVVLQLVAQTADWLEASAFRKVPPRFEEPRIQTREEVPA